MKSLKIYIGSVWTHTIQISSDPTKKKPIHCLLKLYVQPNEQLQMYRHCVYIILTNRIFDLTSKFKRAIPHQQHLSMSNPHKRESLHK